MLRSSWYLCQLTQVCKFQLQENILPKSARVILIYQITSLESVLLIFSSKEEQIYELQYLIKLKASLWGNWNFYQRGDRPGCSCTKEVPYKAKWKQLHIIGGTGPLNTVILIGIYCTGQSTACWAKWPWKFQVSLVYKKSSDVKITIQMADSLSLNGHSYPEIWVAGKFLF